MRVTTAYVLIWIVVCLTVTVGIYVTESLKPLFALFLPSFISISSESKDG